MAIEIVGQAENMASDQVPQIGSAVPYWVDAEWERSSLPMGIHNRLATVEKATMALREINLLRRDDRINRIDAADMEVNYKGLSAMTLEGFDCAEMILIRVAEENLEEVRDMAKKFLGGK